MRHNAAPHRVRRLPVYNIITKGKETIGKKKTAHKQMQTWLYVCHQAHCRLSMTPQSERDDAGERKLERMSERIPNNKFNSVLVCWLLPMPLWCCAGCHQKSKFQFYIVHINMFQTHFMIFLPFIKMFLDIHSSTSFAWLMYLLPNKGGIFCVHFCFYSIFCFVLLSHGRF